jgi:tRNA (mo5U34)-methyltransferase
MERTAAAQAKDLKTRVAEIEWYHTINLGDGIVTPGVFDHAPVMGKYPLPERLDGLRVLDVATFDGYFAFEMERRGAKEVVALDVSCARELDMPRSRRNRMTPGELDARFGKGYFLAHETLRSKVQRVEMNVYDLSPERLGKFDLVHLGSLLLHLKNPIKALENVYDVTKSRAVIADCYSPKLPLKIMRYLGGQENCAWWSMSLGCLTQIIKDSGFSRVELKSKYSIVHRTMKRSIRHAGFVAYV